MGTLPASSKATATRLVTAITFAIGLLALLGGIAEFAGNATSVSRVDAILTVVVGLASLVVGYRVKSGVAQRSELTVLAVVMAVLVVVDAWLSSSLVNLLGLIIPAALLLLSTGVLARQD